MAYATAAQFVAMFGIAEAAGLLADELPLVTGELLKEALAGAFDQERTEEERQQAEQALQRLENGLAEASKLMDGYFLRVVSLPLSQAQINAAPIATCCLELTRCALRDDDDNMTEGGEKRCKRWSDWLRDVATGKVRLVVEQVHSHGVRHGRLRSSFDWGNYGR